MVQLKLITGKLAGELRAVRQFPFSIGRAASAGLQLEEPGVWDHHLDLDFDPTQGFILIAKPPALTTVNGWPVEAVILRNGDSIEIGSQKLNFWIGETTQSTLWLHERIVWAAIIAVTLAQLGLILWLMK